MTISPSKILFSSSKRMTDAQWVRHMTNMFDNAVEITWKD